MDKKVIKVGTITVGLSGLAASFTVESVEKWLQLISSYGPLILNVVLFYFIYQIYSHHVDYLGEHRDFKETMAKDMDNIKKKLYQIRSHCTHCKDIDIRDANKD